MVTIISVNLRSKILFRERILDDFEKDPGTPRKRHQIKIKFALLESAWSKTLYTVIRVSHHDQQKKSLKINLKKIKFF